MQSYIELCGARQKRNEPSVTPSVPSRKRWRKKTQQAERALLDLLADFRERFVR